MSEGLLGRLISSPAVYELAQTLAGGGRLRALVLEEVLSAPVGTLLDIGSGTGWYASRLPEGSSCLCLDNEPGKLRGVLSRRAPALPLLADAGHLPLADRSVDTTLMALVSHHLEEALLGRALDEAARVTRGRFIFLDALASAGRLGSRLLWKLDRGSYPRPQRRLEAALEARFLPLGWRRAGFIHEYLLWTGRARSTEEHGSNAGAGLV